MSETAEKIESPSELDKDEGKALHKQWATEIKLFEEKRKSFNERCKKIVKRYKDERESNSSAKKFNILWANVETLKPTIYASIPKADVKRRFKDQDPVGRVASTLIERAVDYFMDCEDQFNETMEACRDDYVLVGLGVNWQRYVPHFNQVTPDPVSVTPLQVDNKQESGGFVDIDGNFFEEADGDDMGGFMATPEPYDAIEYEEVADDYIHWRDFGHNVGARVWNEVYAVWRIVYMTREELHNRFDSTVGAEVVKTIPLDRKPEEGASNENGKEELFAKATVYEIWDKSTKRAIWLNLLADTGPLDVKEDPLGLKNFFPCPKPLFATLDHESLTPVPDYALYQDQAEEIDTLTGRISHLTDALRVRGLYAGEVDEIKRLFQDANEAELIPVENWAMFAEKGGLDKAISWVPLKDIAETLIRLYDARERAKADLYEITGISDIIRGQSDPDETARAQTIKAQWGSVRVRSRQKEFARFARDTIRIKAEIIAEHFAPETIATIANVEGFPEEDQQYIQPALDLIKNDPIRNFRVEIETDSTIAADEQADKESRIEFMTAVTQFVEKWGPILLQAPQLAPMAGEFLKFAIRGFKTGEALEAIVEQTMDNLINQQAQPQGPSPQDMMQMEADKARTQADMAKAEAEVIKSGNEVAKAQIEAQALPFKISNPSQYDAAQNMTEGGL